MQYLNNNTLKLLNQSAKQKQPDLVGKKNEKNHLSKPTSVDLQNTRVIYTILPLEKEKNLSRGIRIFFQLLFFSKTKQLSGKVDKRLNITSNVQRVWLVFRLYR